MADFMSELWSSVFTPGTTPTLLVATNVTFAALQVLLVTLLVATYSIHFAILSVLCGGLWWSINWFATELKAAQAKEDEAEKLRRRKKQESDWKSRGEVDDSADDEGEDTEVEDGRPGMKESTSSLRPIEDSNRDDDGVKRGVLDAMRDSGEKGTSGGQSTATQQPACGLDVRRRVVDEGDRSGEISTDSEWEKVSEQGDA